MGGEAPREPAEVRFDAKVFALDSVKKAAYRFLNRAATEITLQGDDIVCRLTPVVGVSPQSDENLIAEFRSEVLDQDLRKTIADETAPLRNAILALAFAPSKLSRE